MSKVTTTTTKHYCDICKEEAKADYVHDYNTIRVFSLKIEIYYGGIFKAADICENCSRKLLYTISELQKLNKGKISVELLSKEVEK